MQNDPNAMQHGRIATVNTAKNLTFVHRNQATFIRSTQISEPIKFEQ